MYHPATSKRAGLVLTISCERALWPPLRGCRQSVYLDNLCFHSSRRAAIGELIDLIEKRLRFGLLAFEVIFGLRQRVFGLCDRRRHVGCERRLTRAQPIERGFQIARLGRRGCRRGYGREAHG